MAIPLLQTKLYVPPARPEWVARPRLIERLNDGLTRKLVLISAPAGFGKTTLLSSWLAQKGIPAGWVSIDEGDNDPARFLAYLIAALQAALQPIAADVGESVTAMLQAPRPPTIEVVLTSLINELAALPQEFVLVLDDYHLVHAPLVHKQLAFLLEHQPLQMHLVLATREDPPLPLARWRARGQVLEIRQSDLIFAETETADLLRQGMQRDLAPGDVAALQRRTEGWAAGLHLAALSFRGHDDVHELVQSFTGSHRYILDYLIEEVFERQTPDVQDFLLKTSVLERFSAPLCDAVRFGGAETYGAAETYDGSEKRSHDILHELDQANLFIVPLDQSREWYRYHRLFADLLRQRLRTAGVPGGTPVLHTRAAEWYQANGFSPDAVHHALAGEDWERAAALILTLDATFLKRGEVVTLLDWFRALPEEVVRANPRLCNAYSWPLILTDQIEAAESMLKCAESGLDRRNPRDAATLGQIAVARGHIARAQGDGPRAIEWATLALELLPPESLSERSITAMNLGIAQWHGGRLAEAEEALQEAERAAVGSDNDTVHYTARIFTGRVLEARGRLRQAGAAFRQIAEQGGRLPIVALAHYDLARLYYEWNDLDASGDHAQMGIELSRRGGSPEFLVRGQTTLALIRQAQDRPAAAQALLREAGEQVDPPDLTPASRLHLLALQISVSLAQGDLDQAAYFAGQAPELEEAGSVPGYLVLALARARVSLAQGRRKAAWEQLAALRKTAAHLGWQSAVVRTRTVQALVAPTPGEARAILAEALALAEPEGYTRAFVDLGAPMRDMIAQLVTREQDAAPAYARMLLNAFGLGKAVSPRTALPSPPAQPQIEALSERELEVLSLLAEDNMRHEIAQALTVSVNTVKAHLKSIYGKLDVHDRREAVARARELGLLSS